MSGSRDPHWRLTTRQNQPHSGDGTGYEFAQNSTLRQLNDDIPGSRYPVRDIYEVVKGPWDLRR